MGGTKRDKGGHKGVDKEDKVGDKQGTNEDMQGTNGARAGNMQRQTCWGGEGQTAFTKATLELVPGIQFLCFLSRRLIII